jgi:hypothetical protein
MTIKTDGNVGIGTSNPAYNLDIIATGDPSIRVSTPQGTGGKLMFGNYNHAIYRNTDNTLWVLNNTGGVYLQLNGTSWTSASDQRLKKDVSTISSSLDKIMALNPVEFHWNHEESNMKYHPGFIAQQVEEILPLVIDTSKTNELDDHKGIRIQDMIPYMIKGMQEQQQMIADLQARITSLELKH